MTTPREHALALLLGVGLTFIVLSQYAQWLLDLVAATFNNLPR